MRIIAIHNTWCKPILFAVSLQFVKLIIITGIFKKISCYLQTNVKTNPQIQRSNLFCFDH